MSVAPQLEARRSRSRLVVELATTLDDIRASQALRYKVFGKELGAELGDNGNGLD